MAFGRFAPPGAAALGPADGPDRLGCHKARRLPGLVRPGGRRSHNADSPDLGIGPHEPRHPIISLGSEAETTAWLFLEDDDLSEVTLELVLRDSADHLRRCRFVAIRDVA
jgi:hypothetical protein